MDERRDPHDTRLDVLARDLEDVRRRLDRLEARLGTPAEAPPREDSGAPRSSEARHTSLLAGGASATVALVGRTLVVLGGAFLLRAITDAGYVPGESGAVGGLAYAAAWLVAAERAGLRGRRASAAFHGVAGVSIAYPLLWEATARFGLLPTAVCGALVVAFLGLGLLVARRHGLAGVAWASVLLASLTSLGLLLRTRDLVPFTVALLLVAVAVEILAFHDRWRGLRWPVAVALDLAIAVVAMVELRPGGPPEGYPAVSPGVLVAIGLALAAVYLTGLVLRTLRRGRPVTPFEMLQAPTALLLGYGGAARVLSANGGSLVTLGALGLLLGAAGYSVSFTFLERRAEFGRNFYAYTTLGGLLTLAGTRLVLPAAAASVAWCALAFAAAWLGARFDRLTLQVHAALFLLAGAAGSGLLAHSRDALLGSPATTWSALSPTGAIALAAAALAYAVLARGRAGATPSRRLPVAIVAATLGWSLAGVLASGLGALLVGAPGPGADAASLAAVRTALVAGLAVALAAAGRRGSRPELTWLVYPTLAAGAVKLLAEDLARGRPITQFVGFALYGGALVVVSRLMRGEPESEGAAPPPRPAK